MAGEAGITIVDVQKDGLHVCSPEGIPHGSRLATWRGTTGNDVMVGFSLDLEDGAVSRYVLDPVDALNLCITLLDRIQRCLSHSDRSPGMPSVAVSTPQEGVKVCPPARSSAAPDGVL